MLAHAFALPLLLISAPSDTASPVAAPAAATAAPEAGAPAGGPAAGADDPVALADQAMERRGLEGCKRAAELYKQALAQKPDDAMLQLKTADALNCVIRLRTDNNNVVHDRLNDTEEHKKVWRQLGPEAVTLAKKGYAQRKDDPWALSVYAESYMYESSSFGIIEAIMKGAADEYMRNARSLIATKPLYELGVGHIYAAGFYLAAPWPMSDKDKALEHVEQAVKAFPKSVRNQYYLGVVLYRLGRYAEAVRAFETALASQCTTKTERDVCPIFMRDSRRGLEAAKKKTAED